MSFSPEKYQGRWYEIGKYPFYFEQDCSSATADYIYRPDSKIIDVTNTCYDETGQPIKADHAVAWPNPEYKSTPNSAFFRIRFDKYPQFESDYIVLDTDYNSYALVGSINKTTYWVLSRTPQVSRSMLNLLIEKTEVYGYEPHLVLMNNNILY